MLKSAGSLFHFVSKQDYLIDDLQKGFTPRYCLKDFSFLYPQYKSQEDKPEIGIPMTCFCDIRLSQTYDHTSMYGKYAIGLSKEWGIRNCLTPILYFHQRSRNPELLVEVINNIGSLVQGLTGKTMEELGEGNIPKGLPSQLNELFGALHALTHYMKPIEGSMYRRDVDKYLPRNFSEEREWRYIPQLTDPSKKIPPMLFKEKLSDEFYLSSLHEKLNTHYSLTFTEDDIKYLIVPKRNQINEFNQSMRGQVTRLDIEKPLPKVISYEGIIEDM